MRIRALRGWQGQEGRVRRGDVLEVGEPRAAQLLRKGLAEPLVDTPAPRPAPPPRRRARARDVRILTVLRSGGEYRPEHVERLAAQCARHAPGVAFACLSDVEAVPGRIPMRHGWPGWWCKPELFRIPGPVLYMDLDTVVAGDLGPLIEAAAREPLVVLRDFNPQARDLGSGLMAWSGDVEWLYREFAKDPQRHMAQNRSGRWLGDQGFLERRLHGEPRAYWQEILPGAVVSWKKHCARGVPSGARVVCFHGQPRPWATSIYEDLG